VLINYTSKYLKVLGFLGVVILSLLIFYALDNYLALEKPLVSLFNAFGLTNSSGEALYAPYLVVIDYQCSGFFSIFLFFSLIFSPLFVVGIKRRIFVFLFGAIFLYLLNILRIFLILVLGKYFSINLLHILGWFLMSFFILLIWYNWIFKLKTNSNI